MAHRGQWRKGARVPYAVHPLRVVGRVQAWGLDDPEVLAAAALHDVVEDTKVTLDEVRRGFGPRVAALVDALTHPHGLAPRDRTAVILARLREAPLEALVVKLADRLDNVLDMPGWRASSRLGYLGEAEEIGALARARLAQEGGDARARAALERALPEYDAVVARLRGQVEDDLAREGARRG